MAEMIFFGVIAAFLLFQLINMLGRRSGLQPEDRPVPAEGEGLTIRIERVVEAPKNPSLELLKTRDQGFSETQFMEQAKDVYEKIVLAFHNGGLSAVKDKINPTVYNAFETAVAARTEPMPKVSFVEAPRADIDNISMRDDLGQITVRFLSELKSETESDTKETKPKETKHWRTAEFWTFEKSFRSNNAFWLLSKVKAAKA